MKCVKLSRPMTPSDLHYASPINHIFVTHFVKKKRRHHVTQDVVLFTVRSLIARSIIMVTFIHHEW